MRLHAAADRLVKDLLMLALDDEHHLAEARAVRVAERKVDDKMPLRVDGVICFSPPKRLPIPAAMMTSVGSRSIINCPPAFKESLK